MVAIGEEVFLMGEVPHVSPARACSLQWRVIHKKEFGFWNGKAERASDYGKGDDSNGAVERARVHGKCEAKLPQSPQLHGIYPAPNSTPPSIQIKSSRCPVPKHVI